MSSQTTNTTSSAQLIHVIGLALNASHNCIATDDPDAQPIATSWRIDNARPLAALDELAAILGVAGRPAESLSTDTDRG